MRRAVGSECVSVDGHRSPRRCAIRRRSLSARGAGVCRDRRSPRRQRPAVSARPAMRSRRERGRKRRGRSLRGTCDRATDESRGAPLPRACRRMRAWRPPRLAASGWAPSPPKSRTDRPDTSAVSRRANRPVFRTPRAKDAGGRPRQLVPLDRNVDRPEVVGLHDHATGLAGRARASPRPASPARRIADSRSSIQMSASHESPRDLERLFGVEPVDRAGCRVPEQIDSDPVVALGPDPARAARRRRGGAGSSRRGSQAHATESRGRGARGRATRPRRHADRRSPISARRDRTSEARTPMRIRGRDVSRSRRTRAPGTCRSPRRRAAPP